MNEREKMEMVKMCVDALLEGKELDSSVGGVHWLKDECKDIAVIADRILYHNRKFRIAKPTKKVRYRLYKWSNGAECGVYMILTPNYESNTQTSSDFRGWMGDWQEVGIEE